jgi:hypothetical protein
MNMVRTSAGRLGGHRSVGQRHGGGLRQRWRLFGNVDDSVEISRIVQPVGDIEHHNGREPSDPIGLQQLAHQTQ